MNNWPALQVLFDVNKSFSMITHCTAPCTIMDGQKQHVRGRRCHGNCWGLYGPLLSVLKNISHESTSPLITLDFCEEIALSLSLPLSQVATKTLRHGRVELRS